MICAELEKLEGELDDIISELEQPNTSPHRRKELEELYGSMTKLINAHRDKGHEGGPCYEE